MFEIGFRPTTTVNELKFQAQSSDSAIENTRFGVMMMVTMARLLAIVLCELPNTPDANLLKRDCVAKMQVVRILEHIPHCAQMLPKEYGSRKKCIEGIFAGANLDFSRQT